MPFALGQRWISDTESELGLGTVVAIEARTITILFPVSGENRVYSRVDAPVTRVMFNQGDTITSHEGWQMRVDEVLEAHGVLTYVGTRLDTEEEGISLREVMLDNKLTFSKPQDRLFAGQIDRMDRFALRYRALNHQREQFRSPLRGLRGARASLIPHQLYIAHEVGCRYAPRVLLADEVGLGKTIEAGMIIHQQLLSGRAQRVLVIVPETLQHQWLVEMLRRFNLRFALFDEERCAEAGLDAENPFETEQLVICSLDFIRKKRQRCEQAAEAEWDLLVVDEAHHLVWSEDKPSREYQVVETLTENIPGVLLLTATPEQLGQESHFARLRLLDPDRFHDYEEFVAEQQQYQPVADAVADITAGKPLSVEAQNLLTELLSEQDVEPQLKVINAADVDETERLLARQTLINNLMDRHGTGRVLFRNTRQGVKGFPQRSLNQITLPLPSQYQTAIRVARLMGASKVDDRAQQMLYPEQIYQAFEGENATWWNFDPRVEWLLTFLKNNRDAKVLVICAKAQTAVHLEQALREREAIRAAVFHEGLSIIERDKASAYFAQVEEGAQVLLCSEIGSEGRNFQFASNLVMFDLPMNPDLLEQRIGRLDRIGQRQDIQIHVPCLEGTSQALLSRWFHEGLDAFEHTCPTGRPVYDAFVERLIPYLAEPDNQEGFDELLADSRAMHDKLKAQLESGRDRLLEMHSNGGEEAQTLANEIAEQDGDTKLVSFALNLFDIIGVHQEDRGENTLVLEPTGHMLVPDFPGLPSDGCTVTFDREVALSREDAQFLTWEHPILRNGIDLILSGDTGMTAMSLLKNKALPAGTLLLELVYVVEAQAPKHLQLTRFLPPTPVRLLMDVSGNDLSKSIGFEALNRQLSPVNRHTGSKLVNAVQKEIHAMLTMAEPKANELARVEIDAARKLADDVMTAELDRMLALKAVNPNIREDEISMLELGRKHVLQHLDEANWRLDSLRVVVVTHQ